jgi:Threonine dehydrogenase and related Zn-dependent dehydrogenases
MKALQVSGEGVALKDVAVPDVENEALVRVLRSGICNTDLEIINGYGGFRGTIGHEFIGIVEESGNAHGLVGKRVVGEINAGCGTCELCHSGDSRHCATRTVLGIKDRDGCHAEYLTLPPRNLIVVPDSVPDADAVFVEPLAAALGIVERVPIGREDRVAVIGDGKLGLLCSFAAALNTNHVTLIGKHASKLQLAGNRSIATLLLSEGKLPVSEFDIVIEASGSETGFASALDLVRPRGTIVLKSTFHGLPKWEAWRVVVDEISVVGSRCGRFEPALKVLGDGRISVSDLVEAEFSLGDAINAVEAASKRGTMKVVLVNDL